MGEWCGVVLVMVVAVGRPLNMSMSASPEMASQKRNDRLVAFVIVLATIRTYHLHLCLTRKTPRHSVSCCRLPSPATVCVACSGPASAWQCQA